MIVQPSSRLGDVKEYYFSIKLRELREMIAAGKPVLNLAIGNPNQPPHPSVIQAANQAISAEHTHGYQSYQGRPELRQAMAKYMQDSFGVALDAGTEILPLLGSKEGISHISMAFLNAGDKVLVPNPGYPAYRSVADLVQANWSYYDLVPENGWEPDWRHLESIEKGSVKILWTNYPNMPTGGKARLDIYERLVALAREKQFLIVNDNPYFRILSEEHLSILNVEGAKDVAIELHSLSKSHNMAGWRVGWIAGHAEYLSNILRVKSNVDSGTFYGVQEGAITALSLGKEWFNKLNNTYRERRILVEQIMDQLGADYQRDQVGMFLWAKLPDHVEVETLVDDLLYKKHIFITPGFIFGSQGERYIRISLCCDASMYEEALNRLRN